MIKLKSLIVESIQVTSVQVKIYWNFVLNALSGHNPDDFYRQNRASIDNIANAMVEKYGPTGGGTIYRGIILDPSEVRNNKVSSDHRITYVSFSEDKRIALAFADTENPMAEFMMQRFPKKQGFLITTTFHPSDVLFHHKWLSDTNMWPFLKHTFGDHVKYVEMQKEIITKPKPYYRVEPVQPGESGGLEVGMEQ